MVEFLLLKIKEDELVTLQDLKEKMEETLGNKDTSFTNKWLQSRLIEDFQDEIVIAHANGRSNVITFQSTAQKVLSDFHKKSKDNIENEKYCLIKAAAKLIKNDNIDVGVGDVVHVKCRKEYTKKRNP